MSRENRGGGVTEMTVTGGYSSKQGFAFVLWVAPANPPNPPANVPDQNRGGGVGLLDVHFRWGLQP